jgi:hypothetical protein
MTPDKAKTLNELAGHLAVSRDRRECFSLFGWEVGDGWFDLLKDAVMELRAFDDQDGRRGLYIAQVKEKFGTLRLYLNGYNEEAEAIVTKAERRSEVTCETCGAAGRLRGGGWLYTACDAHTQPEHLLDTTEDEDDD